MLNALEVFCTKQITEGLSVQNLQQCLGDQLHSTASLLDLALCKLGDEFGLDKHRLLGQLALAKHLEDAVLCDVNDWGAAGILCSFQSSLQHAIPQ